VTPVTAKKRKARLTKRIGSLASDKLVGLDDALRYALGSRA